MKKILAIDDDQAVLNYLNIMLLQTGAYQVIDTGEQLQSLSRIKKQ